MIDFQRIETMRHFIGGPFQAQPDKDRQNDRRDVE